MNDFAKEQETLEKYISETGPIIKSLQELQVFFATKELSEAEQAEVWAVPGVIQTYADQAALAKTLLDAIAYYRRESAKVRQQRNNVWLEIAQLKAEENELKKQLHAITEGVKVRDEVVETVARRGCRMIPSDLLAEEETTMPEKRDPACKKRRRSFARKVVDKSKEVINHIRSRSNSRARVNFD